MQNISKQAWIIIAVVTVVLIGIAVLLVNASESDTKDNLAKCTQWQVAIDAKSAIKLTQLEISMCEERGFKMYK